MGESKPARTVRSGFPFVPLRPAGLGRSSSPPSRPPARPPYPNEVNPVQAEVGDDGDQLLLGEELGFRGVHKAPRRAPATKRLFPSHRQTRARSRPPQKTAPAIGWQRGHARTLRSLPPAIGREVQPSAPLAGTSTGPQRRPILVARRDSCCAAIG